MTCLYQRINVLTLNLTQTNHTVLLSSYPQNQFTSICIRNLYSDPLVQYLCSPVISVSTLSYEYLFSRTLSHKHRIATWLHEKEERGIIVQYRKLTFTFCQNTTHSCNKCPDTWVAYQLTMDPFSFNRSTNHVHLSLCGSNFDASKYTSFVYSFDHTNPRFIARIPFLYSN